MTTQTTPFVEQIESIANGFRDSQVLLAAVRLNLFSALGEDDLSLTELADKLECPERGVRIICDALSGLGIIEKNSGRYRNTEDGRRVLCDDSPEHRLHQFNHMALLYERWGQLSEVVRTGIPAAAPAEDQAEMADIKRRFALAMMNIGRKSASTTSQALDLSGAVSLLDVGGGPGLYAIEFAKDNPQLRAVVMDDAETLKVTAQMIEEADMTGRVSVQPGNIFTEEPQESFDFIFISNVVHQYSDDENRELVLRCAAHLNPGGRLCLKDFFLEADRTTPSWSTLFAVNMLVNTEKGDCFTKSEGSAWLKAAGLEVLEPQPVAAQSVMLFGKRPG